MSTNTGSGGKDDRSPDGGFHIKRSMGIEGLVGLQVRSVANRIEEKFPIGLVLEIDQWQISVERPQGLVQRLATQILGGEPESRVGVDLRIRLRHCYVRYTCDGLEIISSSKYRSPIEVGGYSEKRSSSERESASREQGGALDAAATFGTKSKFTVDGKLKAASRFDGSTSAERTISTSQDLYEVEAVPGGWRVGDKNYGDPLTKDRCLDGPYFVRTVDGYAQTCEAEFNRGRDTGSVAFRVTTRDGLYVENPNSQSECLNEREAALAAMRNRLAAICIEQSLAENGEMVLFNIEASCFKAKD